MDNMASQPVYFGEISCQAKYSSGERAGQSCTNKAYYKQGSRYLCGNHSSGTRKELKKNPNASKLRGERIANHDQMVEKATLINRKAGQPGGVSCSKIGMRTKPEDVEGFMKVFPNFKHQGRKDGFGCSSLSPMNLGPIDHGQKGLPPCRLLENYHQFNKVYNVEAGKDKKPTKNFYNQQRIGYKSTKGTRRKYTLSSAIPGRTTSDKPRTLYSIHLDSDGRERKYNYVNSRYFYCHFYERLVQGNKDLEKLKEMLRTGTSLQIVGYDGFPVNKDLMYHYTDQSRPFGHELVLYTLLTVNDPKEYPWNKFYEMNSDLYPQNLKPDYLVSANEGDELLTSKQTGCDQTEMACDTNADECESHR